MTGSSSVMAVPLIDFHTTSIPYHAVANESSED